MNDLAILRQLSRLSFSGARWSWRRPTMGSARSVPRALLAAASVGLVSAIVVAGSARPSLAVKLPADRDTVIMSAHRPNNDGSWGFGWIKVAQGANRGLIGFDLTALGGRTDFVAQNSVRLILWVAKNNFNTSTESLFSLYAFDPMSATAYWPTTMTKHNFQWKEGDDRWDTFSLCSNTDWTRNAVNVPGYPGATWNCAEDTNTSDPGGDTVCADVAWAPVAGLDNPHVGFAGFPGVPAGSGNPDAPVATAAEATTEDCAYPAQNPAGDGKSKCDPPCQTSTGCIRLHPTEPERCFRRVVMELQPPEIARLKANIAAAYDPQSAQYCTKYDIDSCPALHPSYMLKRTDESDSGGGGFYYFSREGAVCILGDKNPTYAHGFAKMVPMLEIDLDPTHPQIADPEPVVHCDQFCEGLKDLNAHDCCFAPDTHGTFACTTSTARLGHPCPSGQCLPAGSTHCSCQ